MVHPDLTALGVAKLWPTPAKPAALGVVIAKIAKRINMEADHTIIAGAILSAPLPCFSFR
jgi:hypothetical protein